MQKTEHHPTRDVLNTEPNKLLKRQSSRPCLLGILFDSNKKPLLLLETHKGTLE